MSHFYYLFSFAPQDTTSAPKILKPGFNSVKIPFLTPAPAEKKEEPAVEEKKTTATPDSGSTKKKKKEKLKDSAHKKQQQKKNDEKKQQETAVKKEKLREKENIKEEKKGVTVATKQATNDSTVARLTTSLQKDSVQQVPAKAVLTVSKRNGKSYGPSIFEGHLLKSSKIEPRVKNIESKDWSLLVVLGIIALLALINRLYGKRLRVMFNAISNKRFANELLREENILSQRASMFLSLLFVLSFSLFAYKLHEYYELKLISSKGFGGYLLLLAGVFIYYFFKILIHRLLGTVLKIEKETTEYIFNLFLFNQFIGLALIPVVVCLLFYNYRSPGTIFSIGICLLVISFTYRTFRGLRVAGNNSGIAKSYLILYLCTLEILPLVVLAKVLINKM